MRVRHFKNNVKIKTVETVLFLTFVKNRIYMASHENWHEKLHLFPRGKILAYKIEYTKMVLVGLSF